MAFSPVDEAVVGKLATIDRALLRDPWDRFIVATALAFDLPLVTESARSPARHRSTISRLNSGGTTDGHGACYVPWSP